MLSLLPPPDVFADACARVLQFVSAERPLASRRAGIMVPLLSLRSSRSWGIGEIGDLVSFLPWAASAGLGLVQLLPINEMPFGESSPYSAMSAMAIDPQFITMDAVNDFVALGGEAGLDPDLQVRLAGVRAARAVDYRGAHAQQAVLRRAFRRFAHDEVARAVAACAGVCRSSPWRRRGGSTATRSSARSTISTPGAAVDEWPEACATGTRQRSPPHPMLAGEILFRRACSGWPRSNGRPRAAARDAVDAGPGGVALFGDLPFMVALDSADVWERQREYRLDVSMGVPPDAFSETGQDWRLPAADWDVSATNDFEARLRARRNAELFDGYRVDHLVGYYRTYVRPYDGSPGALHAGRTGGADRARRAWLDRVPFVRRGDRGRRPRDRARLRARVAAPVSACRATG